MIEYTETGSIDDDRNGWMRVFSRSVGERIVARLTLERNPFQTQAADGVFS